MYGNSLNAFNEMIKFMGFGRIYLSKKGKVPELTITKKDHAVFLLSEYNFGRHNNLNFDREVFYHFVNRKNVSNFRNKSRAKQIEERNKYLNRSPNN